MLLPAIKKSELFRSRLHVSWLEEEREHPSRTRNHDSPRSGRKITKAHTNINISHENSTLHTHIKKNPKKTIHYIKIQQQKISQKLIIQKLKSILSDHFLCTNAFVLQPYKHSTSLKPSVLGSLWSPRFSLRCLKRSAHNVLEVVLFLSARRDFVGTTIFLYMLECTNSMSPAIKQPHVDSQVYTVLAHMFDAI